MQIYWIDEVAGKILMARELSSFVNLLMKVPVQWRALSSLIGHGVKGKKLANQGRTEKCMKRRPDVVSWLSPAVRQRA
jgi:hypothetical protein